MNQNIKKPEWEKERPIWQSYYDRLMKLDREEILSICDQPEINLTFFCPSLGDKDPLEWRQNTDHEQIVMALLSDYEYSVLDNAIGKLKGGRNRDLS